MGKIALTHQSLLYFEKLRKNFNEYRDPNTGSQARLNYLRLTEKLGDTLANRSFHKLMKSNWQKLTPPLFTPKIPTHSTAVRSRALTGMLDLCQTLDPTLTCMNVGDPSHTRLVKRWLTYCAGPESPVCKTLLGAHEGEQTPEEILLPDPAYRAYFNSLCLGNGQNESPAKM
jgi:hypothetical protein